MTTMIDPGNNPFAEDGSEDIEFIPDLNIAFISSGMAFMNDTRRIHYKGYIYLYDFNKSDYKAIPLPIEGNFNFDEFTPHGMSAYVSEKKVTLYVISHPPGRQTVEVFTFCEKKRSLTYVKTISDPLIVCPNDLVVVGADRFYITNTCHFYNIYLHTLEALLQLNVGTVVYYDGQKAKTVASGVRSPNGIAVTADQSYLYVGSILGRTIHVYKVAKDMSIEKHAELSLLTSPDNIIVDAKSGDLWLGCHPVSHELMNHVNDPKNLQAPSQILRLRMAKDQKSCTITEPYANDGTEIRGSSVAVHHKQQILIGTVYDKVLHCDVLSPELI